MGEGGQNEKPSVGGMCIISGTTHLRLVGKSLLAINQWAHDRQIKKRMNSEYDSGSKWKQLVCLKRTNYSSTRTIIVFITLMKL